MSTTHIKTAVGKWLVTHNAGWEGDAWISHQDGVREVRLTTLPGVEMKKLIRQLGEAGVDVAVDVPHPRLFIRSGEPFLWYGTDVDGVGWRWSRDEGGWEHRVPWPASDFVGGEFAFVPRHLADVLGFPWP